MVKIPTNSVGDSAAGKRREKLFEAMKNSVQKNCFSRRICKEREALRLWILKNKKFCQH